MDDLSTIASILYSADTRSQQVAAGKRNSRDLQPICDQLVKMGLFMLDAVERVDTFYTADEGYVQAVEQRMLITEMLRGLQWRETGKEVLIESAPDTDKKEE